MSRAFEVVDGERRLRFVDGEFSGTPEAVAAALRLSANGVELPTWVVRGDIDDAAVGDAVLVAAAAMSWRGTWSDPSLLDHLFSAVTPAAEVSSAEVSAAEASTMEVEPWWLFDGEHVGWDPFAGFRGAWVVSAGPDDTDDTDDLDDELVGRPGGAGVVVHIGDGVVQILWGDVVETRTETGDGLALSVSGVE